MTNYKTFTCANCKKLVTEYPALSREDNKTEICSNCGIIEALNDYLGKDE